MSWFTQFLSWFGYQDKKLLAAKTEQAVVEDWEPKVPTPTFDLREVFLEAIQEVHEETYKAERELLNDTKLRSYIKNVIKAVGSGLSSDRYDFVLIHAHDAQVPNGAWTPFARIMIELFKEIGLPATNEGSYIKVMKADVKKAFGALKTEVVDVDERVRTMLSQGVYR